MNLELLLWLEQVKIWRLQREHSEPKQEPAKPSEDKELLSVSYPQILAAS